MKSNESRLGRIALAFAGVLVLLAVFQVLRQREGQAAVGPDASGAAELTEQVAAGKLGSSQALRLPMDGQPVDSGQQLLSPRQVAPREVPARASDSNVIFGTVLVSEKECGGRGVKFSAPTQTGELRLTLHNPSTWDTQEILVPVKDGAWELECRSDATITPESFHSGDDSAPAIPVEFGGTSSPSVLIQGSQGSILVNVDAVGLSGDNQEFLTVLVERQLRGPFVTNPRQGEEPPPTAGELERHAARFCLPHAQVNCEQGSVLWVTGEGHEWKAVAIDCGDEVVDIALQPAGNILVRAKALRPDADEFMVRVYSRPTGPPCREASSGTDALFSKMPAGEFVVQLEGAKRYQDAQVYAQKVVRVLPSTTAEVFLEPVDVPGMCAVSGSIRSANGDPLGVPAGIVLSPLGLLKRIQPTITLGADQVSLDGNWGPFDVQPGSYLLEVPQHKVLQIVEARCPASQIATVVEVNEEYLITLVDSEDGSIVSPTNASWSYLPPSLVEETSFDWRRKQQPFADTDNLSLAAPPGVRGLLIEAPGYGIQHFPVTLVSGVWSVVVDVEKLGEIRVEFGGSSNGPMAIDLGWLERVEIVNESGASAKLDFPPIIEGQMTPQGQTTAGRFFVRPEGRLAVKLPRSLGLLRSDATRYIGVSPGEVVTVRVD